MIPSPATPRLFRAALLLLAAFLCAPLLQAQNIVMQDQFTYSASDLNNHAPTKGAERWSVKGGVTDTVSASGSQAVMKTNGGVIGSGKVVASYPFTAKEDTLYTLSADIKPTGPVGEGKDCWMAVGFSSLANEGGDNGENKMPWILFRPQTTADGNGGAKGMVGHEGAGEAIALSGTTYSAPITATITWNTKTGEVTYSINKVLQSGWKATAPMMGNAYYIFFQGFQTGNAFNITNVTLTSESAKNAQPSGTSVQPTGMSAPAAGAGVQGMQDNFSYQTPDIKGHAPTMGTGAWTTSYNNAMISANGTGALINTGNGAKGTGSAIASYSFTPQARMLYTLKTTFKFSGPVGEGCDCWVGSGFSNLVNGGLDSKNSAPWLLLRAQTSSSDSPVLKALKGNASAGEGTCDSANYSAPMVVSISWNTSTGEVKYFINDRLQPNLTTKAALSAGTMYAFFEGFQTGDTVSVPNVTLTAQPLR